MPGESQYRAENYAGAYFPQAPLSDHDASGHLTSPLYGYLPTAWVNDLFLTLFVISTVLHFAQTIRSRAWWLLPTVVLAGSGEIIGWVGRTLSHYKPLDHNAYIIQTVTLIISPTPLIGALFITFGRMTSHLGHQYSRVSPRLCEYFRCDFVALLVQCGGGGIAASSSTPDGSKLGSNIMLGGIIFQLVSLSVFCVLMIEYLYRRLQDKPLKPSIVYTAEPTDSYSSVREGGPIPRSLMHLAIALCVESACLYIRAIYRTVELADGWNGQVIQTQYLFVIFDGLMVFTTMALMNVFHPGRLSKPEIMSGALPLTSKVSV
ncbi:RTA1-like protein [Trametes cingulata]|nr:RTA1-like protein [Trametes cingulata]